MAVFRVDKFSAGVEYDRRRQVESGRRLLAREHFAFFRAFVEGVDEVESARRYLDPRMDPRVVRRTRNWIQAELAAAAARPPLRSWKRMFAVADSLVSAVKKALDEQPSKVSHRHSLAGKSNRKLASACGAGSASGFVEAVAQGVPTFEEFAERYEDFDLLELRRIYLDQYGDVAPRSSEQDAVNSRRDRRERLRLRQIQLLHVLEDAVASVPNPSDPLSAWFAPELAEALASVGIRTVDALMVAIRSGGRRWWVSVPRLGPAKAEQVQLWLSRHADEIRWTAPAHLEKPLRKGGSALLVQARGISAGIVPLEFYCPPPSLSGEAGTNRDPERKHLTVARTDIEAISLWVQARASNPNTARAYRREAERFLLWANHELRKPLSSVTEGDCIAYRDFLGLLGRVPADEPTGLWRFRLPQALWYSRSRRRDERYGADWKPFAGALSESSQKQALQVLKLLFAWMCRKRYLVIDPIADVKYSRAWRSELAAAGLKGDARSQGGTAGDPTRRALTLGQWTYVLGQAENLGSGFYEERLRFLLVFAFGTGLRLSETVASRVSMIKRYPLATQVGERTELEMTGKGERERKIPLTPVVLGALHRFMEARGLGSRWDQWPQEAPLVCDLRGRPLGASAVYKILRAFFRACAGGLEKDGRLLDAKTLGRASTHWLRHSCATHAVAQGVHLEVMQRILGHESLQTTGRYTKAEDETAYLALARFHAALEQGGFGASGVRQAPL